MKIDIDRWDRLYAHSYVGKPSSSIDKVPGDLMIRVQAEEVKISAKRIAPTTVITTTTSTSESLLQTTPSLITGQEVAFALIGVMIGVAITATFLRRRRGKV